MSFNAPTVPAARAKSA